VNKTDLLGTWTTGWRILMIPLVLVLAFALVPVVAVASANLVTISSPDDSSQALVDGGALLVTPSFEGNGPATTEATLSPTSPVAVLCSDVSGCASADGLLIVTEAHAVATRTTRVPSLVHFQYVHRFDSGDPPCSSPLGTLPFAGKITDLWVPVGGQAQMQFPVIGTANGKGGIETCVVAYLLQGGPVLAGVTGPFD